MNVKTILERSHFFSGISRASMAALTEICVPKTFEKHQMLFLEGEEGTSMHVLAVGRVQLFKSSVEGRDIVIKIVGPGEVFGEVVLFEQGLYPVTAEALTEGQTLLVPRHGISYLLDEERFRDDFIGMLMKKQRYLTERILDLTVHDVEERFCRFLLEQGGRREEYRIDLTKKDVASAIGTTPETLSRLLLKLRTEGSVDWTGGTVHLREGFWRERD